MNSLEQCLQRVADATARGGLLLDTCLLQRVSMWLNEHQEAGGFILAGVLLWIVFVCFWPLVQRKSASVEALRAELKELEEQQS